MKAALNTDTSEITWLDEFQRERERERTGSNKLGQHKNIAHNVQGAQRLTNNFTFKSEACCRESYEIPDALPNVALWCAGGIVRLHYF